MRGANGSAIKETMIWLEDDVTELKLRVDFFAVCYGVWPRSNATSLLFASRIYCSAFLNDAKDIALI